MQRLTQSLHHNTSLYVVVFAQNKAAMMKHSEEINSSTPLDAPIKFWDSLAPFCQEVNLKTVNFLEQMCKQPEGLEELLKVC